MLTIVSGVCDISSLIKHLDLLNDASVAPFCTIVSTKISTDAKLLITHLLKRRQTQSPIAADEASVPQLRTHLQNNTHL